MSNISRIYGPLRVGMGIWTILIFSVVAEAQSPFPARLDLEAAVEKALSNNPQTSLAASRIRIAEARTREAKTGKKPIVDFTQSFTRSNNPVFVFGSLLEQGRFTASNFAVESINNPGAISNIRSAVNVQVPLFDQNQTRSRVDQAEIAIRQAELQAESVLQKLRFDVIRSFYGAILANETLGVDKQAVRSAQANRKKAKDMVDVGMTTDADFLASEVELARAMQQGLESEGEFAVSMASLNLLLADEPDTERDLAGNLSEKYFPIDDQKNLISVALENRPDYLSALLQAEISRSRARAVRDQKLPRVEAFGNIGHSSPYIANGSTDYTFGVSLKYTIFDAGRRSRVEQAAEAETSADAQKDILANHIKFEVIQAFQKNKTAKEKITVSIRTITQADEAVRIVQDRYKFGLTTFTEVIRSETALVRAKHDLLAARYDYLVSYASVLLATGRLKDVSFFD
jgi:outer membrane protein